MRTHRPRLTIHTLLALAVGLLAACGSGADEGTTPSISMTGSEASSTTVGSTTSSIATTTTEPATPTTQADVVEVVVEGGEVVTGPDRIEAALGSTVVFVVVSDAVDHVHVHGYDIFFEVAPGSPAEIDFTADVPGIFEVELEDSHLLLVELEVS